ncbi:MAG TPA: sulfatase [Baekduia sp.]|jgi:arylsulfatase A-like enzyme
MLRTARAALVAAVLVLVAAPATVHARVDPPLPTPAARPNIVYVLTDDLSDDLLQFMPQVQAMQREGVSFADYFVSDSLCCPSRASLLTGRYPHSTGVRSNVYPTGGWKVFRNRGEEASTFATDLQARGYRTAMYGKYLNEYQPTSGHVPPGWDTWAVSGKGYHEFDYNLNIDGRVARFGSAPRDYLTDVMARRSLRFIDGAAQAGAPFFVELSTFAPHGPATPAPRDRDRFAGLQAPHSGAWDQPIADGPSWLAGRAPLDAGQIAQLDTRFRKRAQSVLAVDRLLGRIRARLDRLGIADNTYIVFNSDNGFHLGQHRLMPGKMTAYDEDVRVPLIVTGPGVPAGSTVGALAQNVDLRSTFDALAGTVPGEPVEGRSLADLIHGRPAGPWRQTALIEHEGPDLNPSDPDYQSAPGGNPVTYEAARFANGLYVESANGEREFYNLATDPNAVTNIYNQRDAGQQLELAQRLHRLTQCATPAECFDAPGPAG